MMRRMMLVVPLVLGLAALGCKREPTRWDQAATEKLPGAAASAAEVKSGGSFNALFPADGTDGASRVFSQEKPGFAEAKLRKDGREFAVLSISDAVNDPDVRGKFAAATERLQGYPLVHVGKAQTALLVKDRYQVKVTSQTLEPEARKAWLERFNLAGVAGL